MVQRGRGYLEEPRPLWSLTNPNCWRHSGRHCREGHAGICNEGAEPGIGVGLAGGWVGLLAVLQKLVLDVGT